MASATLPEKEAVARAVFDRLVAARGDHRLPEPHLTMVTSRRSGARCEGRLIVLEEAAYDLCMAFGKEAEAALATVLAHELIHYYAGHLQGREVLALVAKDSPGDADPAPSVTAEREADYQGGFLAYLAGYAVTDLMPRFLDALYRTYALPEVLTGYPSLAERKQQARLTQERLQRLIAVFEMANVLSALERYDEAAAYYDYLLQAFPSREIHNNTGVVYARAALPYFQPTSLRYVYPIELDLRSRLRGQTRSTGVDPATRDFYLREAQRQFERARLLDPKYLPALVNLAATHTLLAASLAEGRPDSLQLAVADDLKLEAGLRARQAIRLAEASGKPASATNAELLLGILAAQDGDTSRAEHHFGRATHSPLLAVNRAVLQHGSLPPAPPPAESLPFVLPELLDEASLDALHAALPDTTISLSGYGTPIQLALLPSPHPAVTVLRHSAGPRSSLSVAVIGTDYPGNTTMGVGIADDYRTVVREYGTPDATVTTVGGTLAIYPDNKLLVSLREDKVVGWYLYR